MDPDRDSSDSGQGCGSGLRFNEFGAGLRIWTEIQRIWSRVEDPDRDSTNLEQG